MSTILVTTGWWCDNDESDDRDNKIGTSELRKVNFFQSWYESVQRTIKYDEILVIDSASPVKPTINKISNVVWHELKTNSGHSTNHSGTHCGVSRSMLTSLNYAYVNDFDYWVYVEQDALLKGAGIIEEVITHMSGKGVTFGDGKGTPQPIQQSLIVMKRDYIPSFISNYYSIEASDNEISPEIKMLISTNKLLRLTPKSFYKNLHIRNIKNRVILFLLYKLAGDNFLSDAKFLPFGFGRARPIDFENEYIYFQHGSDSEIEAYKKRI